MTADRLGVSVPAFDRFTGGPGRRALWIESLGQSPAVCAAHPDQPMPAASLTKLVIVEALFATRADLDQPVTTAGQLPPTAYPSIVKALPEQRPLSLHDLATYAIAVSDNPSAEYLLRHLGAGAVEQRVGELGLSATTVAVGFRDADLGEAGRASTTTVRDMAYLMRHLWAQRHAPPHQQLWKMLTNNQRNQRLSGVIDDPVPFAHKTGTLAGVVNDVGIFGTSPPILVCALMDGQPDELAAGRDLAQLGQAIVAAR